MGTPEHSPNPADGVETGRDSVINELNEHMAGAGDFWCKLDSLKEKVGEDNPLSSLPEEWRESLSDPDLEDYRLAVFVTDMWGKAEGLEAALKAYAKTPDADSRVVNGIGEILKETHDLASEDLSDLLEAQKRWSVVYPGNYADLPPDDFELAADNGDIASGRVAKIYRPLVKDQAGKTKIPAKVLVE